MDTLSTVLFVFCNTNNKFGEAKRSRTQGEKAARLAAEAVEREERAAKKKITATEG